MRCICYGKDSAATAPATEFATVRKVAKVVSNISKEENSEKPNSARCSLQLESKFLCQEDLMMASAGNILQVLALCRRAVVQYRIVMHRLIELIFALAEM